MYKVCPALFMQVELNMGRLLATHIVKIRSLFRAYNSKFGKAGTCGEYKL